MTTRTRALLLSLLMTVVGACYQLPPPEIVKQADPSPLKGATAFVVMPVTFDGFTYSGQSESTWLQTRNPEQVDSWRQDKVAMTDKLVKRLNMEAASGQTFSKGAHASEGAFAVAVNFDAYDGQMRWTATILDASGSVIDVVRDPKAVTATFNTWAAEEAGAATCGAMVARYLHDRASPSATP